MKKQNIFLKKLILNSILHKFIVTLVFFFIFCYGVWYHFPYIASYIFEPVEITDKQSVIKNYNYGRNYVQLHADALYDTYYDIETITTVNNVETDRKLTSSFTFVEFIDSSSEDMFRDNINFMLIELPYTYLDDNIPWNDVTLKGVLRKEPKSLDIFDSFSKIVGDNLSIDKDTVKESILIDVYLDVTAYTTMDLSWIIALISVSGCFFTFILIIHFTLIQINYKLHKIYRQLAKYGAITDVDDCIQNDYDHKENQMITQSGNDYIFNTYIVSTSNKAIRLTKDLIWVYKKMALTKNGKSHYIILKFKDKIKPLSIPTFNESQTEQVLNDITKALPVIPHYDKNLKKLYKNKSEFNDYYEEFKQQLETKKAND